MKLAVFGSRGFRDYEKLRSVLSEVLDYEPFELVSGGAVGADSLAERFAKENELQTTIFKPDYKTYGKIAPLERNREIAEYADYGIAFWDGKSTGTMYTISHFAKLGKQINVVGFEGLLSEECGR